MCQEFFLQKPLLRPPVAQGHDGRKSGLDHLGVNSLGIELGWIVSKTLKDHITMQSEMNVQPATDWKSVKRHFSLPPPFFLKKNA